MTYTKWIAEYAGRADERWQASVTQNSERPGIFAAHLAVEIPGRSVLASPEWVAGDQPTPEGLRRLRVLARRAAARRGLRLIGERMRDAA